MYEADMAVLGLASKYREQMIYNRYRAGRDTIEKFSQEPPSPTRFHAGSTMLPRPRC